MFRRNKKEKEQQQASPSIPTKRVADREGEIKEIEVLENEAYQPGDIVLYYSLSDRYNQNRERPRGVVWGCDGWEIWVKRSDRKYYEIVDVDVPIQLLERPGLRYQGRSWPKRKFKVYDKIEGKVSGKTVRGQVVVMNPTTEPKEDDSVYLVECESFTSGENGDHGEAKFWEEDWYPNDYKTDSESRLWLTKKDEKKWKLIKAKGSDEKQTKQLKTPEKEEELRQTPKKSVLTTAQERGTRVPVWAEQFLRKFKAHIAHMFVFHFNIKDYVEAGDDYLGLPEYLKMILSRRDFVISYNISSGLEFLKGEEKEFKELVGFKQQAPNPLAQVTNAAGPRGLPRGAGQVLPLLERLLQKKTHKDKDVHSAVIIEYPESVVPADIGGSPSLDDRTNVVTLLRWARDPRIAENGNIIILLASNLGDLHGSLRAQDSGIESVCIEKPNSEERLSYVEWLSRDYKEELEGIDLEQLAYITAGLGRKQIEDVFLRSREAGEKPSFRYIKERKQEILKREHGELLEIMDPEHGMEAIGGLEKVKEIFAKIIEALKKGNWRRVPMGALFVGAPGTGKTVFAEAVAKEADFNFVKMGSVRDKFVGESEKRLSRVLLAIKSLTPVVVFVDEFDQAFGRREEISTDSGVGRRMFGKLLEFMSDTTLRGKVFWVGASNRPDLIDTAMKRPGRFDLKVPFPFPGEKERAQIFKAILVKYDLCSKLENFSELASQTRGYSGGEIEAIVLTAFNRAQDDGRGELIKDDFQWAKEDFIPSRDEKMIAFMEEIAQKECSSRSLLPDNQEERVMVQEKKESDSETKTHRRRVRG